MITFLNLPIFYKRYLKKTVSARKNLFLEKETKRKLKRRRIEKKRKKEKRKKGKKEKRKKREKEKK